MSEETRRRDAERRKTYVNRNRAYIDEIRARTICAHCGAQPIEWHSEAHILNPYKRITAMRATCFSIKTIQAEIDACTPLCRNCHMLEDGRLVRFVNAEGGRRHGKQPPRPCGRCGSLAKITKGLCARCYNHDRWTERVAQAERITALEATIGAAASAFDGCDLDPIAYPALWDAYTLLRRAIDGPPAAPPATTAGRGEG